MIREDRHGCRGWSQQLIQTGKNWQMWKLLATCFAVLAEWKASQAFLRSANSFPTLPPCWSGCRFPWKCFSFECLKWQRCRFFQRSHCQSKQKRRVRASMQANTYSRKPLTGQIRAAGAPPSIVPSLWLIKMISKSSFWQRGLPWYANPLHSTENHPLQIFHFSYYSFMLAFYLMHVFLFKRWNLKLQSNTL